MEEKKERFSNPAVKTNDEIIAKHLAIDGEPVATIKGAYQKTGLLLLAVIISTFVSYNYGFFNNIKILIGLLVINFIASLYIIHNPEHSPQLSPLYSVIEGMFLGQVVLVYEKSYPGAVLNASIITAAIVCIVYVLYATKIVKVSDLFKTRTLLLTLGVLILYLTDLFMLFVYNIKIPFLHEASIPSIIVSMIVISIASMNIIWNFDMIESQLTEYKFKDYFEWYMGFGLLLAILWLYMEVLKWVRDTTKIL